jgi:hypothetical protein
VAARLVAPSIPRQQKTDLTIADFCRQLGVSVPTFYYWKRRVQESPGSPFGRIPVDHPSADSTTPTAAAPAHFVTVSIVDPGAGTRLEIEFANACVVRFRGPLSPRSDGRWENGTPAGCVTSDGKVSCQNNFSI